jgi:hypothetical protein
MWSLHTELRVDASHISLMEDVTLLFICHSSVWYGRAEEQASAKAGGIPSQGTAPYCL